MGTYHPETRGPPEEILHNRYDEIMRQLPAY